jgi:hypothetical protein
VESRRQEGEWEWKKREEGEELKKEAIEVWGSGGSWNLAWKAKGSIPLEKELSEFNLR